MPKKKLQASRGLHNCYQFLFSGLVFQTTSCCQVTPTAGEEKYSAKLFLVEKRMFGRVAALKPVAGTWALSRERELTELPQLCPPTLR